MAERAPFTKAATTTVSVEKSKDELRTLVRRYGAVGYSVREDYERNRAEVEVVLPNSPGSDERVPLRIPVQIEAVLSRLPRPDHRRAKQSREWAEQQARAQAERTAWRIVVDMVDALLMAVELGGRTVADAFMADVVVVRDDGQMERMGDYMARTGGALPSGARALLPAPRTDHDAR